MCSPLDSTVLGTSANASPEPGRHKWGLTCSVSTGPRESCSRPSSFFFLFFSSLGKNSYGDMESTLGQRSTVTVNKSEAGMVTSVRFSVPTTNMGWIREHTDERTCFSLSSGPSKGPSQAPRARGPQAPFSLAKARFGCHHNNESNSGQALLLPAPLPVRKASRWGLRHDEGGTGSQ